MDDFLLELAKAYSPLVGTAQPCLGRDVSQDTDGQYEEGQKIEIKEGARCIAISAAAIFASTSSWDHVGKLTRGQEVFAAGPSVTVDFYTMVPIRPTGAVDRSVLEPMSSRVSRPCVIGSWNNWSASPMEWDVEAGCYQFAVRLGARGGEFQIACNGDWRRCLHPEMDGCDPRGVQALRGPDGEGYNKCWVVGGPAAGMEAGSGCEQGEDYLIRLFVTDDGIAKKVTWIKAPKPNPQEEAEPTAANGYDEDGGFVPRVGFLSRIHGLLRTPALNGEVCLCESWDASVCRWKVRLKDGEVKALKPSNLEEVSESDYEWWEGEHKDKLRSGLRVRVRGLSGVLDLNGEQGTCERFDSNRGRWIVRLVDGTTKAVRGENLQVYGGRGVPPPRARHDDGDDQDEEEGPLGSFLQATRRGAAPQGPRARRLRLGVDIKPSRPGPRVGTQQVACFRAGPPAVVPRRPLAAPRPPREEELVGCLDGGPQARRPQAPVLPLDLDPAVRPHGHVTATPADVPSETWTTTATPEKMLDMEALLAQIEAADNEAPVVAATTMDREALYREAIMAKVLQKR